MTIRYTGGHRFEMDSGNHKLICDQPFANGGSDTGLPPTDLFLFSLGSCAGYYAAQYLNARGLPSADLQVELSAQKGDNPVRLVSINVEVLAPGLNKRHRDGIMRAVESCLISNTLIHPPDLNIQVVSNQVRESSLVGAL